MNKKILLLVGFLLSAVAAESMRETELMDPNVGINGLIEGSGSDDEDIYTDYYGEDDLDNDSDFDQNSGSGFTDDIEDDLDSTIYTPTTTLGNFILDDDFIQKTENEIVQEDNDIVIKRTNLDDDESNEISMASTSNGFFSRTEVVIAVFAGAFVGLVFAIVIVLLVMRFRRNINKDVAYDVVKKPIYTKAPTIEA
ncbi:hypothetical protein GDO81_013083 [Engystomops pustulosus]|uniref:Syndecan/Neurexin domain-containing protein n=1 Tax=Engystomops pustulosus TaxID=76066 RepID=A0AAV7AZ56_ENGPU|nr:hypothetical protein GDO81_013083 [Engystomops pustulosus]KAG8566066.1 hypothetical protein GDO81_013083 [Engystomops pustulosus]